MKQPVVLSIRGSQRYADQDPEVIELLTEGAMEYVDGGWNIVYEESELTGLEGVTTTFRVEPGQVFLTRTGALRDHNSLPPPHSVVLHGVLTPAVVQRARRGGGALCNERAMSALSVQHAVDVRRASQRALSVRRAMSVQRVMSVQRATRVRRALHCALR